MLSLNNVPIKAFEVIYPAQNISLKVIMTIMSYPAEVDVSHSGKIGYLSLANGQLLQIDETLDEVASSMEDYREIEDAMAQPMGSASRNAAAVSDEELEKELEELCKYKASLRKERGTIIPCSLTMGTTSVIYTSPL